MAHLDNRAMANVRDRVTVELEWDLGNAQLGKVHSVENSPADAGMISVPVASPVLLGMPAPSPNLQASPDRKSLIVKQGDWVWTFTPSVTRLTK